MTEKTINHTDLTHAEERKAAKEVDIAGAFSNLEIQFPGNAQNSFLANELAQIAEDTRATRSGHYYRYKIMTRIGMNETLITGEPISIPVYSLLDLDERTSSMDENDKLFALSMGGKGISAELGYADALGDWDAAKLLDEAIRGLPTSKKLVDAGFVFGDTYDAKENAKVTYKFYLNTQRGETFRAVRRRAAADIITEAGHEYEIVKSSSFLVDPRQLSDSERALIKGVVQRAGNDDPANDYGEYATRAGDAIIEKRLRDKDTRLNAPVVLPASSVYFALRRHL